MIRKRPALLRRKRIDFESMKRDGVSVMQELEAIALCGRSKYYKDCTIEQVMVWDHPTQEGTFVIEHANGKCERVNPEEITFEKNRCNLNEPWYPNDDEPHPRYGDAKYLVCDVCGKKVLAQPANFCPSCGAKNHNDCMD